MATIKEIYEEINGEVIDDVALNATSESKVAEHRLITYVVTSLSSILQGLWEIFRTEIQAVADAVPTCNASWWDREIRKFQNGHTLLLNDSTKKYYYETDDAAARIITAVAVVSNRIKVAKAGPGALSEPELAALNSYVKKIQPLGTNIIPVSQAPDICKIVGSIHYDPIVPVATVQTNVELAINQYLTSLNFNVGQSGTFYLSKVIDAIQTVEGVVDVRLTEVSAGQSGAVTLSEIARKYVPVAGYMIVQGSAPLSTTLSYESEI